MSRAAEYQRVNRAFRAIHDGDEDAVADPRNVHVVELVRWYLEMTSPDCRRLAELNRFVPRNPYPGMLPAGAFPPPGYAAEAATSSSWEGNSMLLNAYIDICHGDISTALDPRWYEALEMANLDPQPAAWNNDRVQRGMNHALFLMRLNRGGESVRALMRSRDPSPSSVDALSLPSHSRRGSPSADAGSNASTAPLVRDIPERRSRLRDLFRRFR